MIDRRLFLKKGLAGAAGLGLLGLPWDLFAKTAATRSKEYFLICDSKHGIPSAKLTDPKPIESRPGEVVVWNFEEGLVHEIPVPFLGHGIIQNPSNPAQVFVFEKWGAHAAAIDFKAGKVLKIVKAQDKARFFGHGTYSRDGRHVYASHMDDEKTEGMILVIDAETFKTVGRFPTQGIYPHDCKLHPTEDAIWVMNRHAKYPPGDDEGKQSANPENGSILQLIALKDGKPVRATRFRNTFSGYAHFQILKDGILAHGVVDGGNGRSPISFVTPEGEIRALELPKELAVGSFHGEALSAAANETLGLAAVTYPENDHVHVWDYRSQKHVRSIEAKNPRGIAFSERHRTYVIMEAYTGVPHFLNEAMTGFEDARFAGCNGLRGHGSHMTRASLG